MRHEPDGFDMREGLLRHGRHKAVRSNRAVPYQSPLEPQQVGESVRMNGGGLPFRPARRRPSRRSRNYVGAKAFQTTSKTPGSDRSIEHRWCDIRRRLAAGMSYQWQVNGKFGTFAVTCLSGAG